MASLAGGGSLLFAVVLSLIGAALAGAARSAPTVTGVSLSGSGSDADEAFIAGDAISVTVAFDEAATVTGTRFREVPVGFRGWALFPRTGDGRR